MSTLAWVAVCFFCWVAGACQGYGTACLMFAARMRGDEEQPNFQEE